MVTTSPLTAQTLPGLAVIFGATPEFWVVVTVKVDKYAPVEGAPVKVTVGAILTTVLTAVTVSVAGAADA
jgi:hypothetical protein